MMLLAYQFWKRVEAASNQVLLLHYENMHVLASFVLSGFHHADMQWLNLRRAQARQLPSAVGTTKRVYGV